MPKRHHVFLAIAAGTLLLAGSLWTLRITPAHAALPATATGQFTEGGGWHPGEPFHTAAPVRAWGSWCGSDENTGAVTLGPFAAPPRLRFAVSGYPRAQGNELYVEHVATKARVSLASADAGERWHLQDHALPAAWRGQPVVIRAVDGAKQTTGWLAVTEPIAGGRGSRRAVVCAALALLLPGALWLSRIRRSHTPTAPAASARTEAIGFWALGGAALLPFLACARSFADVWWFGDEWDQLDLIARHGFWAWTVMPFGENVVPLFKTVWGGMAFFSGGAYLPMLLAVWLTHAANTALFARLLRGAGFQWAGTGLACAVFALTVANAEVLGWSVQWSNLLAVFFLLLALDWFIRHPPRANAWDWRRNGMLALLAAAAALTFVRGVLTGIVLALGTLMLSRDDRAGPCTRWRAAMLCLLPTLVVAAWIFLAAPGNHQTLGRGEWWGSALEFAVWFWAAVPFHRLLELQIWDTYATVLLGTTKLLLVVGALCHARGAQRHLLVLLLLFDLGNAALLGLGRHQTGVQFANSSRYYYNALVCTLPFVAFAFDAVVTLLPRPPWRIAAASVAIGVAGVWVARAWPREAELFATFRGRNTREILLRHPSPPVEGAVPGIPFLRTERAKELIAIYHLH